MNCLPVVGLCNITDPGLHRKLWAGFVSSKDTRINVTKCHPEH